MAIHPVHGQSFRVVIEVVDEHVDIQRDAHKGHGTGMRAEIGNPRRDGAQRFYARVEVRHVGWTHRWLCGWAADL